jgi:hypothetical protein
MGTLIRGTEEGRRNSEEPRPSVSIFWSLSSAQWDEPTAVKFNFRV